MSPLRIVSFLIIILAGLETSPQCAAGIFLTCRTFPSGANPSAAVVQDFNNDGISDIASANYSNVSVLLNNGDGTFAPANTFSVGESATEIASADLNRDGNADLVVNDYLGLIYVVLGKGDGTFNHSSRIDLDTTDASGIAIADLNADGILDLAIAIFGAENQNQGKVAILIGVGDGTFAAPIFYPLSHNGVRLVATDLNNDDKLDLAVALTHFPGPTNALAMLLGNGDGTFQPPVIYVPGSGTDVAAADLNADGNMDLALAGDGNVRVLLGNGDGTFERLITYSVEGSYTVAIADLNHDGVSDLVAGGDHIVTLLGKGDGTFRSPVLYGVGEGFARVGYFNSDQNADVVAGGSSEIVVALGKGDGFLRAPIPYQLDARVFDSADFDGDGHPDLVVSSLDSSYHLLFLQGLGDGTFAPEVTIADLGANSLFATDLNGDGKLDIVFGAGTAVYTILGNGDGTFQKALQTALSFDYVGLAVADFNKDGRADVVATAEIFDPQFAILLGRGDGTFDAPTYYETSATYVRSPQAVDLNGDGNLDLAVCVAVSNKVEIYPGNGDGTFGSPLFVSTVAPLYSAVEDLNQDGKLDLLVAGGTGDTSLKLFLGNGDGTFQAPQTIYSYYGPVRVADLDRDGRLDVAIAPQQIGGGLVVLRGRGDGTFDPPAQFPTGQWYNEYFVLSDLNGDAKPEAIAGVIVGSELTVLLNTSHRGKQL